jgi:hypothetical protein
MADILEMLTHERDRLNRAIEALGGEIGGALGRLARIGRITTQGKRRKMSAAARARIAAAQRARWARVKGRTVHTNTSPIGKKRTMSPAARAKIAASQKARWAKIRAGK